MTGNREVITGNDFKRMIAGAYSAFLLEYEKFANHLYQKIILIIVGIIVTCLNLTLLWEIFYK